MLIAHRFYQHQCHTQYTLYFVGQLIKITITITLTQGHQCRHQNEHQRSTLQAHAISENLVVMVSEAVFIKVIIILSLHHHCHHCAYSLHNHHHYVQLWTSASEPLSNLDYLGFPPTGGRWWKSNWFDRNNLHINIFTHRIQKNQKKKQRKFQHLVRNYPLTHPCDWCEKQIEVGRALTCHALSKKIRKTRKLENIIRIIALVLNLCKTARLIQVVFGFASKWDIISDLTNTYIYRLYKHKQEIENSVKSKSKSGELLHVTQSTRSPGTQQNWKTLLGSLVLSLCEHK